MFGHLGTPEILIIAGLLILFFGGKKIPELIKGIADAIREFRNGMKDE